MVVGKLESSIFDFIQKNITILDCMLAIFDSVLTKAKSKKYIALTNLKSIIVTNRRKYLTNLKGSENELASN
jgi:hypothetical protein